MDYTDPGRGFDVTWDADGTVATITPRPGQRIIVRIPPSHAACPADENVNQSSGVDIKPREEA